MKRALSFSLLLVVLQSCVTIQDLGGALAKSRKDPKLVGRWRIVQGENTSSIIEFVDSPDGYKFPAWEAQEGRPGLRVRSLAIGRYHLALFFYLNAEPDGTHPTSAIRYEIKGNQLIMYDMVGASWASFLTRNYPRAVNIKSKPGDSEDYVEINRFDDEVARIISEIPDTEEFWAPFAKLLRVG